MFGSGLIRGLGITARRLRQGPVTELYPYERKVPPAASRTFLTMRVTEDGAPSCKACNVCVVGCPDSVLRLVKHPEDNRRALDFVVNSGRCTFCGLCVENCPHGALYFSQDFERATTDQSTLIYHLVADGRATLEGQAVER